MCCIQLAQVGFPGRTRRLRGLAQRREPIALAYSASAAVRFSPIYMGACARRTAFILLSNFLNTNIHLPPGLVKRKIKFSRKIFVDNGNAVWYHIRGIRERRVFS
jgi:hypothetical protein